MQRTVIAATAEFFGTALLVCVVVGSGIMGVNLSSDVGVSLIINTLSTVFALALLILILGPISGAHLNPVVTLVQLITKAHTVRDSASYVIAQIAGAITGAVLANVMFDLPVVTFAAQERASVGTLIGEVVATAGLIAIIGVLSARSQAALIPVAVATWIGSASFFASSTSFANPAVTIGRMFSDTFAGIAPTSALPFIAAQLVGAALGVLLVSATNRATRTMSTQVNTKQE
ncbi:MAG: aquaporin [Actinobacteria bacterium]|nr:aquaporin [Actinomycetota bacterium]